ncbi:MAG: oligosaccharide flippase family protein [Arenimonas sp.]
MKEKQPEIQEDLPEDLNVEIPAVETLGQSAKQAMLWSAGLTLFRDGLQFLQMLVLVRLLDPSVYGLAGYGYTLINFLGLISFQHVVNHIIQMRANQEVDYDQHFTFGVLLNGTLFLVTNVLALLLPYFGEYSHLQPIIHVLSLTFLLSVPGDLRQRMLERNHQWKYLRPLQMIAMLLTVVSGIIMALAGAGVYALILPAMSVGFVFTIDLFFIARWRPHWRWNKSDYRDALSFGLNRAGSNALNGGRKLFESTLITQYFQFSSLGIFGRAEGLANMFCGRVAQQTLASLYPVITRAEPHSERFQRIAGLVLRSVAWVIMPIAVFFALQADNIIHVLYGQKWLAVVPLLPLAMAVAVAQSLGSSTYSLLLANEERKLCLRSDMAAFVLGVCTIWLVVPFGMHTYLWAAIGVNVIIACVLVVLLVRSNGLNLKDFMHSIWSSALSCAVAGGAMWAALHFIPLSPYRWLDGFIAGLVFGPLYLLALRLLFRSSLVQLLEYVPARQFLARLLILK